MKRYIYAKEKGNQYIRHRGEKITDEGWQRSICKRCLLERYKGKEVQYSLMELYEKDRRWAEIAILRFEFGWNIREVARRFNITYQRVALLEGFIINFLRRDCYGA